MKKILLTGSILFVLCTNVFAQDSGMGVGGIIESTLGVSFKQWIDDTRAIDAAVILPVTNSFSFFGDYLIHNFDVTSVEKGKMPLYYGIGGMLRERDNDIILCIRAPLGIDYLFEQSPMDIFLEVVPILEVSPNVDLDLQAGLGCRYYF